MMKQAVKYLLYYFKTAVITIIFSPIILLVLLGSLFESLITWLLRNPRPEESPDEYKKPHSDC